MMAGIEKGSALSEDIRVIIRDPLGLRTGIMIDQVSCHAGFPLRDIRIHGMMRAADDPDAIKTEPEIYYYFLDGEDHVIHAGRGMHYGSFCVNRSAPFVITLSDAYSKHILNETKEIVIYAAY